MGYIINFQPIIKNDIDLDYLVEIEEKIKNKVTITNEDLSYFLDSICYLFRLKVNKNFDNYDYKCDLFQSILYYYFEKLNCNIKACMTQNVITSDIVGHSFLIVSFIVNGQEQYYILDPSYIQFFKTERCQETNYFINSNKVLLTPDPGFFIKEEERDVAEFLCNHGYILLNEATAGIYGNSFLNTKVGIDFPVSYQSMSGNVYINAFLKGNEVLSKSIHELEKLGISLDLEMLIQSRTK